MDLDAFLLSAAVVVVTSVVMVMVSEWRDPKRLLPKAMRKDKTIKTNITKQEFVSSMLECAQMFNWGIVSCMLTIKQ